MVERFLFSPYMPKSGSFRKQVWWRAIKKIGSIPKLAFVWAYEVLFISPPPCPMVDCNQQTGYMSLHPPQNPAKSPKEKKEQGVLNLLLLEGKIHITTP
jgi:hypothetical protein